MKLTVIPIVIGTLGTIPKRLIKVLENLEIKSGDYPDHAIIIIGQNTEKSPGDLRSLGVTQTSVKDYQLKMV